MSTQTPGCVLFPALRAASVCSQAVGTAAKARKEHLTKLFLKHDCKL